MPITLSRRRLLGGTAAVAAAGLLPPSAWAQTPVTLNAITRVLDVKGKPAKVLGLAQDNGLSGVFLDPGQRFQINLANKLMQETIIHWHGQTPPVDQDGVALTGIEKLIAPGSVQAYDYAPRPGTFWMHSHQGLQEMQLLAAPLIVRGAEELKQDAQEVTVILHDFTFKTPEEVMQELTGGAKMAAMPMVARAPKPGKTAPMKMGDGGKPDLNDFDFDAYLANDRTLDDPMVVRTERNGRVRLRIINAAASTVFWIDLGDVDGTLIAVDGEAVMPVRGRLLPLAEAQRFDIMVNVAAGKMLPVLAQREGDTVRTGVILASPKAAISKVADKAAKESKPMGTALESRLVAMKPLSTRPADRRIPVVLSGSMAPYEWFINGRGWENHEPLRVAKNQRIEFDIVNQTPMGHPMHLHGHVFQVVELNGKALHGAMRDTVQIPPEGSAKIAFDADNPGRWLFHCHNLLHMERGMITEVVYDA